MSVRTVITSALSGLEIPVKFHSYKVQTGQQRASKYITFFTYLERGDKFADNKERSTRYSVQVDVYCKDEDPTDLAKQVKDILFPLGFTRTSEVETEFTDDSGATVYRKTISLNYVQQN
jgi:hypothetical protein